MKESEQNKIKRIPPLKSEVCLKLRTNKTCTSSKKLETKLTDQEVEKPLNTGTPKHSNDQECQTKAEGVFVEISCTDCIIMVSCEVKLNCHMGEDHDKDFISYFESDYPCSVFYRWCRTQKELNRNMSNFHSKRVKSCGFDCTSCDENIEPD